MFIGKKINPLPDCYKYGRLPEYQYKNYIKDKKVILVGPAGYLTDQNKGKYIDSFDIVVRVNHSILVENTQDYGNRTDVLYHILSRRSPYKNKKNLITREEIQDWKNRGLKWLVCRHHSISLRTKTMEPVIDGLVDWITIHRIFYRKLKDAVGNKSPNTGLVAMMHLLDMEPKSLNVVGFDFYTSGVYDGYGDVLEHECVNAVNSRWHDTQAQLNYIKKIRNKKLILDERLKDLLCE